MAESVGKMMTKLRVCLENGVNHAELERKLFHREQILDNVQKEIFMYLSNLVSGQVPHDVTAQAHAQMRLADEYESLSDYVANVLKAHKKLKDNDLKLDASARERILALHDRVAAYIAKVGAYMEEDSADILSWAQTEGAAIVDQMKASRRDHINRLQQEEVSPLFSLVYTDMLNYYRRLKDHALNIAEVIAGEK